MRRKLNQGKRPRIAVDPWDRDMQWEGATAMKRILIVSEVVYSKLPKPKRCCTNCLTVMESIDAVRGNDSRGQECEVYFCPRCKLAHQQ